MPESDALIMQRMPLTVPMPEITPAPGMLLSRSGVSRPKPASELISRNGVPGSSSSASRSRGSS